MPLSWDGTDDGLPAGWDDQVLRSVADAESGRRPNTLGAMQIVVSPARRGGGHAGTMLDAFRAAARAAGFRALIACVRPTDKERYPLDADRALCRVDSAGRSPVRSVDPRSMSVSAAGSSDRHRGR